MLKTFSSFFSSRSLRDVRLINPDDIQREQFKPSDEQHQAYVAYQIRQFKEKLADLHKTSTLLGIGGALDFACFLISGVNTSVPALIVSMAGAGYLFTIWPAYEKNRQLFQRQLEILVATYHWCAKNNSLSVTQNELFLQLATCMAPFVSTKQLWPWHFKLDLAKDLSPSFLALLERPPHSIPNVVLMGLDENHREPAEATQVISFIFKRFSADVVRAIHGVTDSKDVISTLEPR